MQACAARCRDGGPILNSLEARRPGPAAILVLVSVAITSVAAGAALVPLPQKAAIGTATVLVGATLAFGRKLQSVGGARQPAWDLQAAAATVTLLLLATDVLALGPGWGPYAAACLLAGIAFGGAQSGLRVPGDTVLLMLLAWGLAGSLYGRLWLGEAENALAFFVPVSVALLHLWRPLPLRDPGQALRLTRVLMYVSLSYSVLSFVVLVQGWSALPLTDFKHERLYFVAMGVVAAFVLRKWAVLGAVVLFAVAAFLSYPALTWVLVGAAVAAAVAATIRRIGPAALVTGGLAVVFTVLLADPSSTSLRTAYFASVGKGDNTDTREVLLRIGLERFYASPLVGDGFTANIAVPSDVTGPFRRVPVHNDFLQFAMSGGVLGGGLFLAWALVVIGFGTWLVRSLRARCLHDHASLALVATAAVVAVMTIAIFNPILVNARTSLFLGVLTGVLASVRLSTRKGGPPPVGPVVS